MEHHMKILISLVAVAGLIFGLGFAAVPAIRAIGNIVENHNSRIIQFDQSVDRS